MAISGQPEKTAKIELSVMAQASLGDSRMLAIEHDLLDQITDRVLDSSQRQVAAELGISTAWLNDVLRGRRSISDHLAERLGWKRVVMFIR